MPNTELMIVTAIFVFALPTLVKFAARLNTVLDGEE